VYFSIFTGHNGTSVLNEPVHGIDK